MRRSLSEVVHTWRVKEFYDVQVQGFSFTFSFVFVSDTRLCYKPLNEYFISHPYGVSICS